jgi:prepilin-type N-terminal cleavage/methylation domain-containing protein
VRNGFTLGELIVVIALMAVLVALIGPRLGPAFDRIATDGAARDVTTALAVARTTAVMQGTRARVWITPDSLRVDRAAIGGWQRLARWPGPAAAGVSLSVSNPEVVFGPLGIGWGPANTRVVLRRGSQIVTITTSRLGRVKRQ